VSRGGIIPVATSQDTAGPMARTVVGLSLFAGPWQEGRLLAYAHAFERAADARRPPTFPERVA
jgi:amidase